jgi:hypothetical protein
MSRLRTATKRHRCPGLPPGIQIYPFEFLGDHSINLLHLLGTGFTTNTAPAALLRRFGSVEIQMCSQSRRHEVLDALAAEGCGRLDLAEESIGKLDRSLQEAKPPIFWGCPPKCTAWGRALTDPASPLDEESCDGTSSPDESQDLAPVFVLLPLSSPPHPCFRLRCHTRCHAPQEADLCYAL